MFWNRKEPPRLDLVQRISECEHEVAALKRQIAVLNDDLVRWMRKQDARVRRAGPERDGHPEGQDVPALPLDRVLRRRMLRKLRKHGTLSSAEAASVDALAEEGTG